MIRKWCRYIVILFLSVVLFSGCGEAKVKYVFLFIGDGMGNVQMNAAERYLAAMEDRPGIIPLAMNLAPVSGSITTYSKGRYITDSGAAVTAMATGIKTTPGTISMDPEHRYPLKTIAETAKDRGMKVGIISTVDIDHATPAGFYAHQPKRSSYFEIAKQLANSNFDFFAGGDFRQKTDPEGVDNTNIIDLAKRNGFIYVENNTAFRYLEPGAGRVLLIHPDSKEDYAMPYSIDSDNESITLKQILEKSIKMLDNPDGFFIMAEGGQIDWACHANDAAACIQEVLAFDEAIKVALEFYSNHKKNTLILITSDHETGGMSMGTTYGDNDLNVSKLQWQTGSFTELTREYRNIRDVLIDEHGPDSIRQDADWAFEFVLKQTGLGDPEKDLELNEYELNALMDSYERSFEVRNYEDPVEYILYGSYDPFMVSVSRTLSRKAGIGWTTFSHTGVPVPVRAFGAGASDFDGYYDNTDIFFKLQKLIGNGRQKIRDLSE